MTTLVRTGISILLLLVLAACSQTPIIQGVLDPQVTENQKFTYPAGDAHIGGLFGNDVAIDGDLLVVGAMWTYGVGGRQGAAYLYQKDLAGTWQFVKKLLASDGAHKDDFGQSVAISGNTVVVGAYSDVGTNENQGSAYIFERDQGGANTWGEVKKLIASDGALNDYLGHSVAISGNTIVVGAFGDDVGANLDQGSAYIFARNQGGANNWGEVKKLVARDGRRQDYFGYAVAMSGNTVVVGSIWDDILRRGTLNQGSAYVFSRDQGGTNNWGHVKKLLASDGGYSDEFGFSVAISGTTIIIGTYFQFGSSAYIFERDQGGANRWGEIKKLVSPLEPLNSSFGYSVAINGNRVVVGATSEMNGTGVAYLFARNLGGSNAWGQSRLLTGSDAEMDGSLGYSVAISSDTAVVGNPYDDFGPAFKFDQGSVNIYNY